MVILVHDFRRGKFSYYSFSLYAMDITHYFKFKINLFVLMYWNRWNFSYIIISSFSVFHSFIMLLIAWSHIIWLPEVTWMMWLQVLAASLDSTLNSWVSCILTMFCWSHNHGVIYLFDVQLLESRWNSWVALILHFQVSG